MASRARWTLIGASVISVLGACAPSLPSPQITSISPDWVDNDREHTLSITGENLYPQILVTGDDALDVNQTFRGWLTQGDDVLFELGITELQDYARLTALVPEGLPPGIYDLRLETPAGLVDVVPDAVQITETAAATMVLAPEQLSYPISEKADVALLIQDPDGATLDASFPVRVSVLSGPGTLSWDSTLLEQAETAGGLAGMVPSGGGALRFEASSPGVYRIRVEADEENSHVAAQEASITFEPGDVADIELLLELDEPTLTAGDDFYGRIRLLDAQGNPTSHPQLLIFSIEERCANAYGSNKLYIEIEAGESEALASLRFFVASGTEACREGRLDVEPVVGGLDLTATSEAVTVLPGEASTLKVLNTFGSEFVAGESPALLLLAAEDAYGNALQDYNESLSFDDGMGGVQLSQCQPWSMGQTVCSVTLIRAAASVVLTVESRGGLRGSAQPITVLAGPLATLAVDAGTTTSVAGSTRSVDITLADAYDNPVSVATTGAAAPRLSLDGSPQSCQLVSSEPGQLTYGCTLIRAGQELALDVSVGELSATSAPFQIVNGPLADIKITGTSDVVAGESLLVTISGYDVYGNPFVEVGAGSRELEIYNDSGEVSELLVSLGTDGSVSRSILLTEAWDNDVLHAYQSGSWLGSSASYDILSADMAGFSVETGSTWAALDAPLDVTARAVDAYGNTVTTYADDATLSSTGGLGTSVSIPASAFWDGVAETAFLFDVRGVGDTLRVSDGTATGSAALVDVVSTDCAVGPLASLSVDGAAADAVLCRTETGETDTVTLSASGSSAGSADLRAWHFYTDEQGWTRSTSSASSAAWHTQGASVARLLLVDSVACADQADVTVYVADDDGLAAGPIDVVLRDSTLSADSTSAGQTVVDIAAYDCAGAAASGDLLVRATVGEVTSSGTTTVTASGAGLELTLDSLGQARVLWDVGGQDFGALSADLYVGRSDGAALGVDTATVSGDAQPPVLLSMSPTGSTTSTFKTLTLTFSEEIDADTVGDDTVSLIDPDGLSVSVLDYSVDGSTVTLTLSSQTSPSTGAYVLSLDQEITDADGNALSGDYSGSSADFSLTFGRVTDSAPDMTSCSTDRSAFRPDGDDGTGAEGDTVKLSYWAGGLAAWWHLQVLDAAGSVVYDGLTATNASSGSLTWDGRDQAGVVVENGTYTLQISARDGAWNEGSTCTAVVELDNRLP